MKVVDMFGSGLPVLAKKYSCLDELVKEGDNGHMFDSASDLADILTNLLRGFPLASVRLENLKENLSESPMVAWEDNWDANVWPLVRPLQ